MGCKPGKIAVASPTVIKCVSTNEDTLRILSVVSPDDTVSTEKSSNNTKTNSSYSPKKLVADRTRTSFEPMLHPTDMRSNSWQPNGSEEFIQQIDQRKFSKNNIIQSASISPNQRKFTPDFNYPTRTSSSNIPDILPVSQQSYSDESDLDDSESSAGTMKTILRREALERFMSAKGRDNNDDISVESYESYPILDSLSSGSTDHEDAEHTTSDNQKKSNRSLRITRTIVVSSPIPRNDQRTGQELSTTKLASSL